MRTHSGERPFACDDAGGGDGDGGDGGGVGDVGGGDGGCAITPPRRGSSSARPILLGLPSIIFDLARSVRCTGGRRR
jgi:hypothetical protein